MLLQTDVAIFEAVSRPLPANVHYAFCWYIHIKFYKKDKASPSGVKKALGKYGSANVEDTTGSGATDSKGHGIDSFGCDEEEESKADKRQREESCAQYESKKANNVHLLPSLP